MSIEFYFPANIAIIPDVVVTILITKLYLIMFSCDVMSDNAGWNEGFHYWDTKLSSTVSYSTTLLLL